MVRYINIFRRRKAQDMLFLFGREKEQSDGDTEVIVVWQDGSERIKVSIDWFEGDDYKDESSVYESLVDEAITIWPQPDWEKIRSFLEFWGPVIITHKGIQIGEVNVQG